MSKFTYFTYGKTVDNKGAFEIPLLKGSVIIADRFYNDFSLLNIWDSSGVFFVIRHKENDCKGKRAAGKQASAHPKR